MLGLEGSVDGTSLSKTVTATGVDLFGGTSRDIGSHDLRHPGFDSRPLGVAWDRALIYATGGVAFGGFNTTFRSRYNRVPHRLPVLRSGSFSTTRVGWTVGGGIEYAVTNNWSVRAEYRYTNLGIDQHDLRRSLGAWASLCNLAFLRQL